jgi:S-adenosylmethionine synthetase
MAHRNTKYLINPTGRFVVGGPQGDCGLTGARSLSTPTAVPAPTVAARSAAKTPARWTARPPTPRYVAKNIVAAGLAAMPGAGGLRDWCGQAHERHGLHRRHGCDPDEQARGPGGLHFDLRPKGIIQMLDLLRPIYEKTAAYGHFGREEPEFTWERTDKAPFCVQQRPQVSDPPMKLQTQRFIDRWVGQLLCGSVWLGSFAGFFGAPARWAKHRKIFW